MAKQDRTVGQVAEELGVSAKWIRKHIAEGTISPTRRGNRRNGRFALTVDDVAVLGTHLALEQSSDATESLMGPSVETDRADLLARVSELESDRENLQAHVAWARAIAKEQQKALEYERERIQKLTDDLERQRARVEALKALSALDRLMGRHKTV